MRTLLPREQALLWIVGVALVLGVFYMFIYTPKSNEAMILRQRLNSQQAEVTRLEAQARRKADFEQEVTDLQTSLKAIEAKLPPAREIPTFLVQLEDLAKRSGVAITSVRPGVLQDAVTPGSPSTAGAQPPRAGGGTAPAQQRKPAGQAKPGLQGFKQFSIELTTEGSFASLVTFVKGIEAFPRYLAISDLRLNLAPEKEAVNLLQPLLTLGMTATAYVAPASELSP